METMFMQNFEGQTKSIMVFLKVAYSKLRRKVETGVDRMTGIELETLQLRRLRTNPMIYACLLSRNTFSPLHDNTNDDSNKECCKKDPCMAFLCFKS